MATTEIDAAETSDLSLRDQLDQAFTDNEGTDDAPAAAPAAPATEPAPPALADEGRQRDPHGRFAPAPAAGQQATTTAPGALQSPAAGVTPPPGGVPPAPEPKAPASWRPEAREKWVGADPVIRQEVMRREHEMQTVLQDAAAARQFVQAFESVVRPYEMFMRAENASPLQSVQNLMQTAADLRVGTPQHKANLVAGIINNFGIDVVMLDSILAGQPGQGGQQQQQVLRDPRVDMLLAQQQQAQQQHAQQSEAATRTELETFAADPKHEFYRDVASTMADLVEIRAKQGQPVDLEKIYAQACQLDESVATILATRAKATQATGNAQAVLRAKRAAVSVKGDSTLPGATVPNGDSIRASIEAAMSSLDT